MYFFFLSDTYHGSTSFSLCSDSYAKRIYYILNNCNKALYNYSKHFFFYCYLNMMVSFFLYLYIPLFPPVSFSLIRQNTLHTPFHYSIILFYKHFPPYFLFSVTTRDTSNTRKQEIQESRINEERVYTFKTYAIQSESILIYARLDYTLFIITKINFFKGRMLLYDKEIIRK